MTHSDQGTRTPGGESLPPRQTSSAAGRAPWCSDSDVRIISRHPRGETTGISNSRVLVLYALCNECAVRLMKDHFVDDGPLATEFNNEALQFDYAEPSALLRRKAIGRLVIGLQYKLPFCIQRPAMGRRAALECTDAPRAESRICTVARRKAHEHDIFDHWLKRCRETDDVPLPIGQESDR